MKLFRSLSDQRADLDAKLNETRSQAAAHNSAAVEAALGNGNLDKAEAAARSATDRASTLAAALATLDERIAAEAAAKIAAALKAKRDQAVKKARKWNDDAVALLAKLQPLIAEAHALAQVNDSAFYGHAAQIFGPERQMLNAAVNLPRAMIGSFAGVITKIEAGDDDADDLASRVLQYQQ